MTAWFALMVALVPVDMPRPMTAPIAPSAVELTRATDGLFYVDALVNGQNVHFRVDTGAATTVLTAADAARVGAVGTGEMPWAAETANGERTLPLMRVSHMNVGITAVADVTVAIAPDGLDVSLLGANLLSRVSSMTIEGDRMTLE